MMVSGERSLIYFCARLQVAGAGTRAASSTTVPRGTQSATQDAHTAATETKPNHDGAMGQVSPARPQSLFWILLEKGNPALCGEVLQGGRWEGVLRRRRKNLESEGEKEKGDGKGFLFKISGLS